MNCPKVCIVEIAGKGGICHYTYSLAQALTARARVELCTGKEYELDNHPRKFRVYRIFNRFATNPFTVFWYFLGLRKKGIEIVHFQLSQFPIVILFLIYLVKFLGRQKIVLTTHNVVSHEQKKWEFNIYKEIYNMADMIVVHAEQNRTLLHNHFQIPQKKAIVIHHGNYMFFNEDLSLKEIVNSDHNVILFFGYIRKYKGLHYLLKAFAKVHAVMPEAKLLIVGKPVEPFTPYQKLIEELQLKDNVETVLEYVPFTNVKDYFHKAAIVALPYVSASQSGIIQLAYSFGKPIVATSVGGLPEILDNGKNGFIVPPENETVLAEKIVQLLSDQQLLKKMGEYSLTLSKTKFSWDTIAEETKSVYSACCED